MSPPPTASLDAAILWGATIIEFVGGLFVVGACLRAVVSLVRTAGARAGVVEARLTIAQGAVAALGFKTAATLLKTLELRSWGAIATFAAILALRTFIKSSLAWESGRLRNVLRERRR